MTSASDVQHEMLLLALDDRLYTSPDLPKMATVLDIGTGTGTWACQVAARHPNSRVYGIDLHQVKPAEMPVNVVFETVNVMTGFPFNTGTFDLVHSRLLVGGITDWSSYLESLLRITKRGGHVECIELELRPLYKGQGSHEEIDNWTDHMAKMLTGSRLRPDIAESLEQSMRSAGFLDVQDRIVETPIGPASQDSTEIQIGQLAMKFSEQHMIHWLSVVMLEAGSSEEEVSDWASRVKGQLTNQALQPYFRWHFVTGRKGG